MESRQTEARVPVLRHRVARTSSTATPGKAVENDLVKALRELPEERPRLEHGPSQRPMPELQGRDGLRPVAGRPELRVLRLAGARRLQRDQGADPAGKPAAVQDPGRSRPRRHAAVAEEPLARAEHARARVADRHGAQPLHSVLDVRRQRPLSVGSRGRTLLLRQRAAPRLPGPHRHAAGAPRALGAGRGRNRRTRSTTSRARDAWHRPRPAPARSNRFPRRISSRTTPPSSRATSSSTTRSCSSMRPSASKQQMHQRLEELCAAAGARRHLPQSRHPSGVLEPDVQARARAGLAPRVRLSARRSIRSWPTATPA